MSRESSCQQLVVEIVSQAEPKLESVANNIESVSNLYMQSAEKIEASKFSEHL